MRTAEIHSLQGHYTVDMSIHYDVRIHPLMVGVGVYVYVHVYVWVCDDHIGVHILG